MICEFCWQECEVVEETIDYAGTHCTHGRAGTHHTGHYVSDCCGASTRDDKPVSNCCGAYPLFPETDLCSECKEHADFE